MSVHVHAIIAMAGAGIATGAGSTLSFRLLRAFTRIPPQSQSMPWFTRLFRNPAILIAPAITPLLSEGHVRRIAQSLASVELEGAMTPATWVGVRVVHALGLAFICGLASFPIRAPFVAAVLVGLVCGYSFCGLWMRGTRQRIELQIARDLPSYLDLLTVCVEAGATLTAGVNLIIEGAPDSPLRRYFEHVLREVRGGQLRTQAFERVASLYAVPSLSALAAALGHAESSGMSLGGILRAQGRQRTAERFARAERLAMQAPVKLLGPLILCIFPCTFVVLAVPIVVRLAEAFEP